jgi:hypothetical protein
VLPPGSVWPCVRRCVVGSAHHGCSVRLWEGGGVSSSSLGVVPFCIVLRLGPLVSHLSALVAGCLPPAFILLPRVPLLLPLTSCHPVSLPPGPRPGSMNGSMGGSMGGSIVYLLLLWVHSESDAEPGLLIGVGVGAVRAVLCVSIRWSLLFIWCD